MSGHLNGANIKTKRMAKTDEKAGCFLPRSARKLIHSCACRGAEIRKANSRLNCFIQKAKAMNMPNDNIQRANPARDRRNRRAMRSKK
jgi:transcriptional/translational regulatory protein YebC/TACO1